jgi:hypothetical protein
MECLKKMCKNIAAKRGKKLEIWAGEMELMVIRGYSDRSNLFGCFIRVLLHSIENAVNNRVVYISKLFRE